MSSLEESRKTWEGTQSQAKTLESLQHAVRTGGSSGPTIKGYRSVCWKTFLLFGDNFEEDRRAIILRRARDEYSQQSQHFLRFIRHPEALAELTVDPLTDDPASPWNTIREDEIMRTEIQQDVQRLPDEANYHDVRMQLMILDILFVYCKNFPERNGYRQGMHELLAPLIHVIDQDAINASLIGKSSPTDACMVDMLDSTFIEHDAYALFAHMMQYAQVFYEVTEPQSLSSLADNQGGEQRSAIVDRSKRIHEVYLAKVDPELAAHLTRIEVLPQIFLIRWIRLLFSREFPFLESLALWDSILATDPTLEIVDLICVAMLLRIRWQLLEADYSVCLQLLLRYPPPPNEHGPSTFVEDASYLQKHLDASGGSSLIHKYTGKTPAGSELSSTLRPGPPGSRLSSFRQHGFRVKSPLNSPSRFLQQQGGVEALFQRGAKGVFERGEKLGINQAVRDAMEEIRRNVQNMNDASQDPHTTTAPVNGGDIAQRITHLEQRNRELALLLQNTVLNLKSLSPSKLEDTKQSLDLIEITAAKIQLVQVYLEDSSMELPRIPEPASEASAKTAPTSQIGQDKTQDKAQNEPRSPPPIPRLDISGPKATTTSNSDTSSKAPLPQDAAPTSSKPVGTQTPVEAKPPKVRPGPIPTRSTLAQSSFSWMLEPDQSSSSPKQTAPPPNRSSAGSQHRKKGNVSREKNAFLFGERSGDDTPGKGLSDADEIFGMKPLPRTKGDT